MTDKVPTDTERAEDSFAEQAGEKSPSFLREMWDFVRYNKKWWLIPIVVVLLLVGILVLLTSNQALAPFIYPL